MRNIRATIGIILVIGFTGCATYHPPTAEIAAYQSEIRATPTAQHVPKGAMPYVWAKVQAYVVTGSEYRIELASDVVIQTYSATNNYSGYSFRVMKNLTPDGGADVVVSCQGGDPRDRDPEYVARQLSHEIARWVREYEATNPR